MRLTLATVALMALTSEAALASSFTYITEPPGTNLPSFVTVSPPEPIAADTGTSIAALQSADEESVRMVPVSTSIIALESPTPSVTFEKVASIVSAIRAHLPTPMVMRGGIVGGPFATAEPAAAAPEEESGKPAGDADEKAKASSKDAPVAADKGQETAQRETPAQPAEPQPAAATPEPAPGRKAPVPE